MAFRVDGLDGLPPSIRAQAAVKLQQQGERKLLQKKQELENKKPKYHNSSVEANGIKFDSKKERRRYDELVVLLNAGVITDLKLQEEYTLIEAYTTPNGERVRRMKYTCDFSYIRDGKKVVEDVKSTATRTQAYMMRKKLMLDKYGIVIQEV